MNTVQKNPDLERLEIALVQLGFALEQQEIQAESERTRQKEMKNALLARIDALEARLRELLDMGADKGEGTASSETQEGR
ncbi:hypothetical protein [Bombella mellum]|uniref:Accessory factor UbiK family protein n=1 Tax=Bombella mellum TaxID=2039288 RepID=A0ABR5ZV15_9PROT|nr:hypothetical protein [Bombella mellum]MBA5728167.1 hypothetical protein [Bombella mellum]